MVVVTQSPVSEDSDEEWCSEDLDECDAMEASEASRVGSKELRGGERMRRLMALRSMVPTGTGSLAQDTAAYVQQLRAETHMIEADIRREEVRLQQILLANKSAENKTMVKVEMDDSGLNIQVDCEKRPRLALGLWRVIDGLGLTVIRATMGCYDRIRFCVFCEKGVGGVIVDPERVKALLLHTINYKPGSPGDLQLLGPPR